MSLALGSPARSAPKSTPRLAVSIALSIALATLAVVFLTSVGLSGCGPDETSTTLRPTVLSVEEAQRAGAGGATKVRGVLVARDNSAVLASALLESYPPQAGGATLPLEGLDLPALVGLSSTAPDSGFALVTWSDYPLVLEGVLKDGKLQVQGYPPVTQVEADSVRVRFSPASAPVFSGDTVWWAFEVTNTGAQALELVFSSGQRGEVVVSQGGAEKYRWSAGKAFTEAIESVRLEPGRAWGVVLNDVLPLESGEYEIAARVTASVGPAGDTNQPGQQAPGAALPELKTSLRVW